MTEITINALSNGKKFDLTFTVAKDITEADWDQTKNMLQMAMSAMANKA